MADISLEEKMRYYNELSLHLEEKGFEIPGLSPMNDLLVDWNGRRLCMIAGNGGGRFRSEDMINAETVDAKDRVSEIAHTVSEYMRLMEVAPQLKASGLSGDYRMLADFGGAVLAGHPTQYGVEFITWDWDFNRKGVSHGHYFEHGTFAAAKQDFAVRAGLVPRDALFTQEQLTVLYECLQTMQRSKEDSTQDYEKLLDKLQEQLERLVPDVQSKFTLEIAEPLTVREFLSQHPEATVSMMMPDGFCTLTPSMAREALEGKPVVTHPGVSEHFSEADAEMILGEVILDGNLSKGIWCLLTDYPEQKMGPPQGLQMGGLA